MIGALAIIEARVTIADLAGTIASIAGLVLAPVLIGRLVAVLEINYLKKLRALKKDKSLSLGQG